MCYALLTTCIYCTWTLHITHPLCEHAQIHHLSRQGCPMRMKRKYTNAGTCNRCVERLEDTEAEEVSSHYNDKQAQHINNDDDEEEFIKDKLVFLSEDLTEIRIKKAAKALKTKLPEDEGSHVPSQIREEIEVLEEERIRLQFAKKPRRFKVDATGKKKRKVRKVEGSVKEQVDGRGRTRIRGVECR